MFPCDDDFAIYCRELRRFSSSQKRVRLKQSSWNTRLLNALGDGWLWQLRRMESIIGTEPLPDDIPLVSEQSPINPHGYFINDSGNLSAYSLLDLLHGSLDQH